MFSLLIHFVSILFVLSVTFYAQHSSISIDQRAWHFVSAGWALCSEDCRRGALAPYYITGGHDYDESPILALSNGAREASVVGHLSRLLPGQFVNPHPTLYKPHVANIPDQYSALPSIKFLLTAVLLNHLQGFCPLS
jgi:hypothetical protein